MLCCAGAVVVVVVVVVVLALSVDGMNHIGSQASAALGSTPCSLVKVCSTAESLLPCVAAGSPSGLTGCTATRPETYVSTCLSARVNDCQCFLAHVECL